MGLAPAPSPSRRACLCSAWGRSASSVTPGGGRSRPSPYPDIAALAHPMVPKTEGRGTEAFAPNCNLDDGPGNHEVARPHFILRGVSTVRNDLTRPTVGSHSAGLVRA